MLRTEERPAGRFFYGWWIVGASFVVLLVTVGVGLYAPPVFLVPLQEEFGWNPAHSLDAGLAETVEWYLGNRTWWERVLSEAYRAASAMYLGSPS